MGEKEHKPFQFTFNGFLRVAFQGSRVTSDAGLLLVRELDDRPGMASFIAEHLSDSRHGLNMQFRLAELLRQSVYSRLAGYEDLNDAERLAADPRFRLIGSPKISDRGAALTSTLHWFETALLTREENLVGLMAVNQDELAHWTRLSCHRFRANEVRLLQLSVLAYNLGNLWRRLVLPTRIDSWSLTSVQ